MSSNSSTWIALATSAVAVAAIRAWLKERQATAPAHEAKSNLVFADTNSGIDEEGRVHHLHIKRDEVANRILSVGDAGRAERIASLFDEGTHQVHGSTRGFVTHTGRFNGVEVSVIATGMGTPMMDFVVRETRAIVQGPMAIMRFGTCGGIGGSRVGTVVVNDASVLIRRDPDAVHAAIAAGKGDTSPAAQGKAGAPTPDFPYSVSKPVKPDAALCKLYHERLCAALGGRMNALSGTAYAVKLGMGASADSFYSSQGRTNNNFYDRNATLIARLEETYPTCATLEMETFHLLDLAMASKPGCKIYGAGAAIVIADRVTKDSVSKEELAELELLGGRAALETLTGFAFPGALLAAASLLAAANAAGNVTVTLLERVNSPKTWWGDVSLGIQGPSDPIMMVASWVYDPVEVVGVRPKTNTSWKLDTTKSMKYQSLFLAGTGAVPASSSAVDSLLLWNEKPSGIDGTCVLYGFNSAVAPSVNVTGSADAAAPARSVWKTVLTGDCININVYSPFSWFDISADGSTAVAFTYSANSSVVIYSLDGQTGAVRWTKEFEVPDWDQQQFLSYGVNLDRGDGKYLIFDMGVEGLSDHFLYVLATGDGSVRATVPSAGVLQGALSPDAALTFIVASKVQPLNTVLRWNAASSSYEPLGDVAAPLPSGATADQGWNFGGGAFGTDPRTNTTYVAFAWYSNDLSGSCTAAIYDVDNLAAGPIQQYTANGIGNNIAFASAVVQCAGAVCAVGWPTQALQPPATLPTVVLLVGSGGTPGAAAAPSWTYITSGTVNAVSVAADPDTSSGSYYVAASDCASYGPCVAPGGDAYLWQVTLP